MNAFGIHLISKYFPHLRWLIIGISILVCSSSVTTGAANPSIALITVCPTGCDHTTIQAAVNAADPGDTIQLMMTSPHTEADIVVNQDLTIKGLGGSVESIVQAADTYGSASNRVITIINSKVTLQDLHIRYGVDSFCGGIYNDGGTVSLNNVSVTYNQGGGIVNDGIMTVNQGLIRNNISSSSGGGIRSSGTLDLKETTISVNTGDLIGGGIYSIGTLNVYHSWIKDNTAADKADHSGSGGGIYSYGSLTLVDSLISRNRAITASHPDDDSYGAGLYIIGSAYIRNSDINSNSGTDKVYGGGIYSQNADMQLEDVTISNNSNGQIGGGIYISSGEVQVRRITIEGNEAQSNGAGIYIDGDSEVDIINSTISGNETDRNGGGIYLHYGQVNIANTTVTDNTADADKSDDGTGGGVYNRSLDNTVMIYMRNSLIAGNFDMASHLVYDHAPDCYGSINSGGYNLIGLLGTSTTGTPCVVLGDTTGNITGEAADLDTLDNNGGPTETHALLSSSPAIDAGNPTSCLDYAGVLLTHDQRGALRIDRCDIGAFELGALTDYIYLPMVIR